MRDKQKDFLYIFIVVLAFSVFLLWLFEREVRQSLLYSSNRYAIAAIAYLITGALLTPVLSKYLRKVRESTQSDLEIENEDVRAEISKIRRQIRVESDEKLAKELASREEELRAQLADLEESNFYDENGNLIVDWVKVLSVSRRRLISETSRLSARSSTNLVAGILVTSSVIFYLLLIIFMLKPSLGDGTLESYLSFYLPHATLIIIVQLLAGFFLKLFVGNERDIQRNKNEITNIELRLAAGMMASQKAEGLLLLALKLATEERNFVLEKKEKAISRTLDESITKVSANLIEKLVK